MSKGSKPRPFSVSQEHYASEWDRIFSKARPIGELREAMKPSVRESARKRANEVLDALKGDGDTFEEKVSLSDEMRLHAEKHKPEGDEYGN